MAANNVGAPAPDVADLLRTGIAHHRDELRRMEKALGALTGQPVKQRRRRRVKRPATATRVSGPA